MDEIIADINREWQCLLAEVLKYEKMYIKHFRYSESAETIIMIKRKSTEN